MRKRAVRATTIVTLLALGAWSAPPAHADEPKVIELDPERTAGPDFFALMRGFTARGDAGAETIDLQGDRVRVRVRDDAAAGVVLAFATVADAPTIEARRPEATPPAGTIGQRDLGDGRWTFFVDAPDADLANGVYAQVRAVAIRAGLDESTIVMLNPAAGRILIVATSEQGKLLAAMASVLVQNGAARAR